MALLADVLPRPTWSTGLETESVECVRVTIGSLRQRIEGFWTALDGLDGWMGLTVLDGYRIRPSEYSAREPAADSAGLSFENWDEASRPGDAACRMM